MYALNNRPCALPDCQAAYRLQLVLLCAGLVNPNVYSKRARLCSVATLWMLHHLLVTTKHSPVAGSTPLSEPLALIRCVQCVDVCLCVCVCGRKENIGLVLACGCV